MSLATSAPESAKQDVLNQPPLLVDYNLFDADKTLVEGVKREGGDWGLGELSEFGKLLGSTEFIKHGYLANQNSPILQTFDRFGNRIDEVEFHPSWHILMAASVKAGVHCLPWEKPREGAHVVRAGLMMLADQNEQGHCCPISMTYSVVPVLQNQPDVGQFWLDKIATREYDSRFIPAAEKTGVIFGMGMTEKQGGSDVRANITRAVPDAAGGPGKPYRITGHKWFCSAPMSDAFLILAQAPNGLSCFLLPRWTPEGNRNDFHIQRLKDKLGNRSNASSEIEFNGSIGWLIGEEGRGARTIIDMVNHTRLDCVIQSAALMRQGLVQALHHIQYRSAFGKKLIDQPLMRNVAADLTLESDAATTLMLRLARAYDRREEASENAFRRIATAIAKYWLCKRTVHVVAEALECLGGNGYVEESMMPRLFREAPLGSIWEGSGNVICLDVLRAMTKEPETVDALMAELKLASGNDSHYDAAVSKLKTVFANREVDEARARMVVEELALCLQASLLLRFAPSQVAKTFCATRLSGNHGYCLGTIGDTGAVDAILKR